MRDWGQPQAARRCPCLHLFSALLLRPAPVSHRCPPQDCSDPLQSLYHAPHVLTQLCNLLSQLLAWLPLLSQYPWAFVFCPVPVRGVNEKSMNEWQTCAWRPEIPSRRPVDVEWSRSPCSQGAIWLSQGSWLLHSRRKRPSVSALPTPVVTLFLWPLVTVITSPIHHTMAIVYSLITTV